MARPCGHDDGAGKRTDVAETETKIITEVLCYCGTSLSCTSVAKIRPTQPGTGGQESPRRNR